MANDYTLESINVMEGLTEQWHNGEFCDAKLIIEGEILLAHKCVLSAASPYFRSMFLGKFQESKKEEVEITGVTHPAMHDILGAIYTNKLKPTNKTVGDLLSAADFLQFNEIVEKCEQHMIAKLTNVTCLQFLKLFDKYSLEKGQKAAHDFIVKNFKCVSINKDFLKVSKEAMCSYLTDENLQVDQEMDVFSAVKAWIEHDKSRLEFAAEMMGEIRLAQIPADVLRGEVREVPFVHGNKKCRHLVSKALGYHSNVHSQPIHMGTFNKPRGKPSLFIIEEGKRVRNASGQDLYAISNDSTKLWHVPVEDLSKRPITSELSTPFAYKSVSVITYGNFMFLFGVDSRSFTPVSMRYDGNTNTWINLAPIPREAAVRCAVARIGNDIIVAGGMTVHKNSEIVNPSSYTSLTSDVYKYDIKKDSWSKCAKYSFKFAFAGACEFKGLMFVAGGAFFNAEQGHVHQGTTSTVYAYDIKGDLWLRKPDLPEEWRFLSLAVVNEKLHAFGGRGSVSGISSMLAVLSEDDKSWDIIQDITPFKRIPCGSDVHGNTVFILGGDLDRSKVFELCDGDILERSDSLSIDHSTDIANFAILTLKQ